MNTVAGVGSIVKNGEKAGVLLGDGEGPLPGEVEGPEQVEERFARVGPPATAQGGRAPRGASGAVGVEIGEHEAAAGGSVAVDGGPGSGGNGRRGFQDGEVGPLDEGTVV